jgi:hypothetical protein
MRGSRLQGRFNLDYETKSMYEGIQEDLQQPVGMEVDWFRWSDDYRDSNYATISDDTYDVSSSTTGQGRRWMLPFNMPCVAAQLTRGNNLMNERGFYVVDTLRLVLNVGDVNRLVPTIVSSPSNHIKDRILYRGEVFSPTRIAPQGAFGTNWAVITVDCNMVNSEELVNDPQFQQYALKVSADLQHPTSLRAYGGGWYGGETYGDEEHYGGE